MHEKEPNEIFCIGTMSNLAPFSRDDNEADALAIIEWVLKGAS